MSYKLWKDQRDTFELLDLRGRIDNVLTELTGNGSRNKKRSGNSRDSVISANHVLRPYE